MIAEIGHYALILTLLVALVQHENLLVLLERQTKIPRLLVLRRLTQVVPDALPLFCGELRLEDVLKLALGTIIG